MRFLVVTLAPTLLKNDSQFYSYGPYVKEMNIWFSNVEEVIIVSPTKYKDVLLLSPFLRKDMQVVSIPSISFTGILKALNSLVSIPLIFLKLIREMRKADHIHLRCPGNIGLIGCLAQVFFPKKSKTAKYAGNWDPQSKQPLSYRFQKWLLSNTFLTKNMQVLVYGDWPGKSINIKSFFTASYPKDKIEAWRSRDFSQPFQFVFVGSLAPGKRPLYAIKLVELISENGIDSILDFYGDGVERDTIERYIEDKELKDRITLHGNQDTDTVEKAYKRADFLVLPSKSEGWPKVVAEAMFWGVIPIVSRVSCVPWMLAQGNRGVLLEMQLENDVANLVELTKRPEQLTEISKEAQRWSQQYNLDYFSSEIQKLVR